VCLLRQTAICTETSTKQFPRQVVAEMLARGMIGRKGQSSAILIAPTSSLVASVAFQKDAASRINDIVSTTSRTSGFDGIVATSTDSAVTTPCRVHVVHGRYDETSFCPNQQRWSGIGGLQLHVLPDNHVLSASSSLRCLTQILEDLLVETNQQCDSFILHEQN
jgi:hypothetical protein